MIYSRIIFPFIEDPNSYKTELIKKNILVFKYNLYRFFLDCIDNLSRMIYSLDTVLILCLIIGQR